MYHIFAFNYFDALRADQVLITKFGKEYSDYMKKIALKHGLVNWL